MISQTAVFLKKLLNLECFLIFPTAFVVTHYACQILMKLEFSGQFKKKCSNIKFYENLSSGS
jgi:hypothetical protein